MRVEVWRRREGRTRRVVGAEYAVEELERCDVGEEIGAGQGVGFLAERVELGLNVGLVLEPVAVGARGVGIGLRKSVEIGVLGTRAGEEAGDEFAVRLG